VSVRRAAEASASGELQVCTTSLACVSAYGEDEDAGGPNCLQSVSVFRSRPKPLRHTGPAAGRRGLVLPLMSRVCCRRGGAEWFDQSENIGFQSPSLYHSNLPNNSPANF
jgi:hypothetical protein